MAAPYIGAKDSENKWTELTQHFNYFFACGDL